jgi:Lrp/AsnC family transcriptional regulator, leucine-responsive regulatory protein
MDEIDRRILCYLMRNARMSFRDLGSAVHLSPNATAERVRRLQGAGTIRGFRTEVHKGQLGFSVEAFIDVKLQPGTTAKNFEKVIAHLTGIVSATVLTGDVDFRLRVSCKDNSDLAILIEALRDRAGVQETNSSVIVREIEMPERLHLCDKDDSHQ